MDLRRMNAYAIYALKRLFQFALVVFIGINLTYLITHATPIDPVEQSIAAATQYGSTSPEAIALMRQSLKELYGLEGGVVDQYLAFWRRILVGDFGPSLSAFPTPVSVLIGRVHDRSSFARAAAVTSSCRDGLGTERNPPPRPRFTCSVTRGPFYAWCIVGGARRRKGN